MADFNFTNPYNIQISDAQQKKAFAQKLKQDAIDERLEGNGAPISWTQGLAKVLKSYMAGKQEREASDQIAKLESDRSLAIADLLKNMPTGDNLSPPEFGDADFADNKPRDNYMSWALKLNALDPNSAKIALEYNKQEQDRMQRQMIANQNAEIMMGGYGKSPIAVLDESGNPRYVPQQKAVGMTPYRPVAPDSLVEVQQGDKVVYTPRNQAAGMQAPVRSSGGSRGNAWRYDSVSGTWVSPPTEQSPQGQQTASSAKTKSAENFRYLANQFMGKNGLSQKTLSGGPLGVQGLAGKVFDYKDNSVFNNAKEQLSTELRTLFRIPGEGSLSDKEQAQYGIQLPDPRNNPEVNEKIINDLLYRVNNKVSASSNSLSPKSQPIETNQPKAKFLGFE